MNKTLELLDQLVGFPTTSRDSNLPMIEFLTDYLVARGFEVHQIDDPLEPKAGLLATIGPKGPGGVLLSGHTDVVPTDGQSWSRPDFKLTLDDDRAYGRGTTDMKGFVASMLMAAELASKADLKRALKLSLSYDEEIGCVGIEHMIDHVMPTIGLPDLALVGEPTSMQVAIGHKGKGAIRATCYGQNGHSALAPQFVNALHLASDFVSALRSLQSEFAEIGARDEAYTVPYSTLHVGKLYGGVALNMVPEKAMIDFEYRHLAADDAVDLMACITDAAKSVEASYQSQFPGASIELDLHNSYPGLDVAIDSSVISEVQSFAQASGTTKVAFGTEAGYFDQLGIPTVVCGPGSMENQGHKPDEFLHLAQLSACDQMMTRIVDDLARK